MNRVTAAGLLGWRWRWYCARYTWNVRRRRLGAVWAFLAGDL